MKLKNPPSPMKNLGSLLALSFEMLVTASHDNKMIKHGCLMMPLLSKHFVLFLVYVYCLSFVNTCSYKIHWMLSCYERVHVCFVDELNVSKTEVQRKDEETSSLKDQLSDAQKLTDDQSKMVVNLQGMCSEF